MVQLTTEQRVFIKKEQIICVKVFCFSPCYVFGWSGSYNYSATNSIKIPELSQYTFKTKGVMSMEGTCIVCNVSRRFGNILNCSVCKIWYTNWISGLVCLVVNAYTPEFQSKKKARKMRNHNDRTTEYTGTCRSWLVRPTFLRTTTSNSATFLAFANIQSISVQQVWTDNVCHVCLFLRVGSQNVILSGN